MSVGCVQVIDIGKWESNRKMLEDDIFVPYTSTKETYHSTGKLASRLNDMDLVVGFNNHTFDNNVICEFAGGDQEFLFNSFDILEDLVARTDIKYLTNLDDLTETTLAEGKDCSISENAPDLWAKGEKQKVIDQCLGDVELTAKIFMFGVENGYVLVKPNKADLFGNMVLKVPVDWCKKIK